MNKRLLLSATCMMVCFLLFLLRNATANVSLRNGNFFIEYDDFSYEAGINLRMERVYNSKSPFLGIFGWGWGSGFEVYGHINPDGSFLMNESGGGAQNVFEPVNFDANAKAEAVDLIAGIIMKDNPKNPLELAEYRNKLTTDREFFLSEWGNLIRNKKATAFEVPVGTRLVSTRFGYEELVRTEDGYVRVKNDISEIFNNDGRLVKVIDRNNNFYIITYSSAGVMRSIEDNLHNKADLYIGSASLVDSIICSGTGNWKCFYGYNEKKELIFSSDAEGNRYSFEYDQGGRHNMTRIKYSDSTYMQIGYWSRDLYENVRSVRDRDGTLTTYEYTNHFVSQTEQNLIVKVNVFNSDKRIITSAEYRYELKTLPGGKEYTSGLYSNLDGSETYTRYNENNYPLMIIRGKDTTSFRYNSKNLVIKKETNSSIRELQYTPQCLKISKVSETSKPAGVETWTSFEYDASCNLAKAVNSSGDSVRLIYNKPGQIVSMRSKEGVLLFEYNKAGKPVVISLQGTGTIEVTYSENGEVQKVDSKDGRRVALKVTSSFQELLELIRPAGVTLSF